MQDCGKLQVHRGTVIGLSDDGQFAYIRCYYGAVKENISIECMSGTWADTQCEFKGKIFKISKLSLAKKTEERCTSCIRILTVLNSKMNLR